MSILKRLCRRRTERFAPTYKVQLWLKKDGRFVIDDMRQTNFYSKAETFYLEYESHLMGLEIEYILKFEMLVNGKYDKIKRTENIK